MAADRLCFVADARSPIAQSWVRHFVARGDDVHLVSTFPTHGLTLEGVTLHELPIAFAGLFRGGGGYVAPDARRSRTGALLARVRSGAAAGLAGSLRFWITPLEVRTHAPALRRLLDRLAPRLVHAMRIPFEAIVTSLAIRDAVPFVVSVWGNDFTLFAGKNPLLARQTRRVLARADALHCDCARDLRLAREWGYAADRPGRVLPTAGGLAREVFHPGEPSASLARELGLEPGAPLVFNARGVRDYVRNDAFFRAVPLVLAELPAAVFACASMEGHPIVTAWTRELGIERAVRLLPPQPHAAMADLFRLARVSVSPSTHDGTPNSLLEAMACGSFPVAGDIESVREWIADGVNGLLVPPGDERAIARAIVRALTDTELRERAVRANLRLVAERAEYEQVMTQADALYAAAIARHG